MTPEMLLIFYFAGFIFMGLTYFIMRKMKVDMKNQKVHVYAFLVGMFFLAIPILIESKLSLVEKTVLLIAGIVIGMLNMRDICLARKVIHKK
jgi:uncharacterized membrane protein YdcZ (DUF606 family)